MVLLLMQRSRKSSILSIVVFLSVWLPPISGEHDGRFPLAPSHLRQRLWNRPACHFSRHRVFLFLKVRLFPNLREFVCFVFRPEQHRRENNCIRVQTKIQYNASMKNADNLPIMSFESQQGDREMRHGICRTLLAELLQIP